MVTNNSRRFAGTNTTIMKIRHLVQTTAVILSFFYTKWHQIAELRAAPTINIATLLS